MQPMSLKQAMRPALTLPAPTWEYELLPSCFLERVDVNGKRHYAVPNGEKYPSVTTVLSSLDKDGIKKWEARVGVEEAEKIRTKAAFHGTHVHSLAEEYLKGNPVYPMPGCSPNSIEAFKSIVPYLRRVNKVYGIEQMMYSDRLKTAGTSDLLCEFDNIGTVLDYKTSRTEKKEEYIHNYFLQATTYSLMVWERYRIKLPQIVIVIAVADSPPQLFVRKVKDYVDETITLFKTYHVNNS